MTLKYHFDFLSQPSRSVYIFLKLNNIQFEACPVDLLSAEHLTEEFKTKLNRFQKVPFIHDGDFKLSESIAIIRYLTKKYNLNNKWYPSDAKLQAQVDEYLEWQHNNTRALCALYFLKKYMYPKLTGEEPHPDNLKKFENNMVNCLQKIETIWLFDKPFLAGNEISVADIFAACEIEQIRIAGFDLKKERPVLSVWLDRVKKETSPYYEEAHATLNELVKQEMKAKL